MPESRKILTTNLVGLREIADRYDTSVQRVSNWKNRHKTFPKPVAQLAMGPVYDMDEVVAWVKLTYVKYR